MPDDENVIEQPDDGQDSGSQDADSPDAGGPESDERSDAPTCPACDATVAADANWCEACGHDLAGASAPADTDNRAGALSDETGPEAKSDDIQPGGAEGAVSAGPCQACGETDIDTDGYCLSCGYRQPSERNHVSEIAGPVAAATDRGGIRHRNEDAFAIAMAAGGQAVMVVCDGVSSTPGSEEASTTAAQAACQRVVAGLDAADGAVDGADGSSPMTTLLMAAVADAQQAATSAAETVRQSETQADGQIAGPLSDPPSTTLVCAVVSVDESGAEPMIDLHVAWVGDSRCYWVTADDEQLLTTDHEEFGALSRWLGADAMQPEPDVVHHRIPMSGAAKGGWVLVCSDGLWRYLTPTTGIPAHELMAALTHNLSRGVEADPDPSVGGPEADEAVLAAGRRAQETVEGLLEFANNRGGHDNITAAITSAMDLARSVQFTSAT